MRPPFYRGITGGYIGPEPSFLGSGGIEGARKTFLKCLKSFGSKSWLFYYYSFLNASRGKGDPRVRGLVHVTSFHTTCCDRHTWGKIPKNQKK